MTVSGGNNVKISRKRSIQSIYYTNTNNTENEGKVVSSGAVVPPSSSTLVASEGKKTNGRGTTQQKQRTPEVIRIVSALPIRIREQQQQHRVKTDSGSSGSSSSLQTSSSSGSSCGSSEASTKNPEEYLLQYLRQQHGMNVDIKRFDSVHHLFHEPKQFEIEAYGFEALDAVRNRNIDKLQTFLDEGKPLKCSNRFGESILHLACRKAFCDVVQFLLNTAKVPLWVKDDFGRSPMHDACWTIKPDFRLMDILIDQAPDLLLVSDARGHTPLAYARREHWKQWVEYLEQKGDKLKPTRLVGGEEQIAPPVVPLPDTTPSKSTEESKLTTSSTLTPAPVPVPVTAPR